MTNNSFIDYWDAVDAAMVRHFGTHTGAAGIGAGTVSDGFEHGWSPDDFAFWCGENYGWTMLCVRGV